MNQILKESIEVLLLDPRIRGRLQNEPKLIETTEIFKDEKEVNDVVSFVVKQCHGKNWHVRLRASKITFLLDGPYAGKVAATLVAELRNGPLGTI